MLRTERPSRGFTLLEVLVALAIAAVSLGLLLSLSAGSKRLAWRGEEVLLDSVRLRSELNRIRLEDGQGTVPPLLEPAVVAVEAGLPLEQPARQTLDSPWILSGFELRDAQDRLRASGTYWQREALP